MPGRTALLLAAHGERAKKATNAGLDRLAAAIRAKHLVDEVAFGLIKGSPSIPEAVAGARADHILVYPLFLADGYFTRRRLPELLAEGLAGAPRPPAITTLTPLGLDPHLDHVVGRRADATARERGFTDVTLILLAHGSTKDPASRMAAEGLAGRLAQDARFHRVRIALLEEPPFFADAMTPVAGPAVVVGLFAGEGLHGGGDAPRLVAETGRNDVAFAGNLGAWPDVEELVCRAVAAALPSAGSANRSSGLVPHGSG